MALAIVLKNAARIQATPKILKVNFTQFVNGADKRSKLLLKVREFVPKRNMSADHSKLWPIERALSIALIGITPWAILSPSRGLDDVLAISTVIHFHWGLEATIVDYVRPILVGPVVPKAAMGLLYVLSISTLGGLLYYNHHNIGIGSTIQNFWAIKSKK
ncbi:succinate dehydrogenase [ubiquinone] cytochrome b small subunit, mitochondrial [Diorhabda carinulata]|uniref:succinate dehydrogenase [ubiquinone] cytochrome b small subunit, mitochondrial n=1 Tax=Diorhabda sublineata TaxID=1163346 RepID=UPI0024E0C113|nr:succinate dehydrogenase [ubiquinone] cytochrome b small subunit, mitochondrial [Diorhabda sublineata]XP_057663756.1 succinate dehydrogenase [ubiquinone] cytochrome b small subunit, mitochondrial [Diorhabda carinulata]